MATLLSKKGSIVIGIFAILAFGENIDRFFISMKNFFVEAGRRHSFIKKLGRFRPLKTSNLTIYSASK